VVCHSIANILWFHICNEIKPKEIERLFLVAVPSLACDIEELKSFFPCEIPKNLHAKESLLIASTNDPYMTQDEALDLQKRLDIPIKFLEGGGHINNSGGYGEWPWILEKIKN